MPLQLPETFGNPGMRLRRRAGIAEQQQSVLDEQAVEFFPDRVRDRPRGIDAGDFGADGERPRGERHQSARAKDMKATDAPLGPAVMAGGASPCPTQMVERGG